MNLLGGLLHHCTASEVFLSSCCWSTEKGGLRSGAQLCCSVLDSIGGAESYSVSVSWVGSPANVQGFDNVPAPQSQKNLRDGEREREQGKSCKWDSVMGARSKRHICWKMPLFFAFQFRHQFNGGVGSGGASNISISDKLGVKLSLVVRGHHIHTDLSCLMNSTSCPWWHFLMQFTQMALRSVVLQVWHLQGTFCCCLFVPSFLAD